MIKSKILSTFYQLLPRFSIHFQILLLIEFNYVEINVLSLQCCQQNGYTLRKTYETGETRTHNHVYFIFSTTEPTVNIGQLGSVATWQS